MPSAHCGAIDDMTKMRKVIAVLPTRDLEAAMRNTGLGVDDTLRIVLELYVSRAKEAANRTGGATDRR